jgi:hypothetical protein
MSPEVRCVLSSHQAWLAAAAFRVERNQKMLDLLTLIQNCLWPEYEQHPDISDSESFFRGVPDFVFSESHRRKDKAPWFPYEFSWLRLW